MSLFSINVKSRIRPKVWLQNEVLYAETAILVQILSLFSYCRHVKVYRQGRFIKIETRWLWFLTTQKYIPFSRISRIETEFYTAPVMKDISWTDRYEEFSIFLRLQNPYEYYWLISFGGEGVVLTSWSGLLLKNDNFVGMRGDQEITFQHYYRLLKKFVEPNWVLK